MLSHDFLFQGRMVAVSPYMFSPHLAKSKSSFLRQRHNREEDFPLQSSLFVRSGA